MKERLWTKNFTIVFWIHFILILIFYLLFVTMSAYAIEKYGASPSLAGLAAGIFIIGALFGRLAAGRLIEQIGRVKMLSIGLVIFAAATCLYLIEIGLPFLILTRFVNGFAFGISSTSAGTIVAQVLPKGREGEGIGYYSLSGILATAIGPFIGLYIISHADFSVVFLFCIGLALMNVAAVLFLRVEPVKFASRSNAEGGFKLARFIEPNAVPISIVYSVVQFSYASVLSFLTLYAGELGFREAAGYYFFVYAVFVILSRPFTGKLFDSRGANIFMYPAVILYGAGMLIIALATHSYVLILASMVIGISYGNFISGTQTIAIKVTPPERYGLANSTFFIFGEIGHGFGPFLLGLLLPLTGFRGMYMSMLVVIAAVGVLYYFLYGRKEKKICVSDE